MWKAIGIALAGVVAVSSSFVSPVARTAPGAQQAAAPTDGAALFATYCAACHGRGGQGDGPMADALRTRPSNLTQIARPNGGVFPAERVRGVIDGRGFRVRAHGTLDMPVWGDAFVRREGLTDAAARARIDALVRYLDTIQERAGH